MATRSYSIEDGNNSTVILLLWRVYCRWCPDEASAKEMVKVMFPLLFDATTEYIAENVSFRRGLLFPLLDLPI